MTSYAYYKLPYSDHYTLVTSDSSPMILPDIESISGSVGFVIVPFAHSEACPIVLIRPDSITRHPIPKEMPAENTACVSGEAPESLASEEYMKAFTAFHGAVSNGVFRKLVLARRKAISHDIASADSHLEAFHRACQMYPRLMVMLFSTPQTGTWIIASPEILIEGHGDTYHTVALAGTMPYSDGYLTWSEKNKGEQHVVEQYINDTISPFCTDLLKDGPVTSRAGNLVHLRTDFRFHLRQGTPLGGLVKNLHPTPAVCGLPKQEACEFIQRHEGMERRYYSGFAGPLGIDNETHLYVSLRCAHLSADGTSTLYAGGGIMPGSTCQSEWQETESKMRTIGSVLE